MRHDGTQDLLQKELQKILKRAILGKSAFWTENISVQRLQLTHDRQSGETMLARGTSVM